MKNNTKCVVKNTTEMMDLGQKFARTLSGGEVLELVGDIGVGKTTFTQGLAKGLGVVTTVNSPSFTIMKEYAGQDGLILKHYDFYRLDSSGVMKNEILDGLSDERVITVIEWAKDITGVLPEKRQTVKISYLPDNKGRLVKWS